MASLRDLGLSEYESRAFRSLLETGPTTAKELSRASDVPMGRIYDVLNSLETYNLVRSQTASRPKKYVAVEPETALDRLLDDRKRELEEKVEQYESIVDELAEQLETAEPVDEPFWTAALGPEETSDLLVERLSAAEERIVMVASARMQPLNLDALGTRLTEEVEAALDRGVEVSVLLRPEILEQLPAEVGERYRDHLRDHESYAVRTSENVSGTFELIDQSEVCIDVPHPLEAGETFAVIDLKDREFAASVEEAFTRRWEEATPLRL
jgi:sugar-specific transcriptional regulator TrmB